MLFKFLERRFGLSDAHRELMTASAMIDDASRDYKNRRLVGDGRGKRINFEVVISILSSK